jgi:hypothetical protein
MCRSDAGDAVNGADQLRLRKLILEAVNDIIRIEEGPVPVSEVRVVAAPTFFGLSHGTALLLENGDVVLRVAVERPAEEVVDTILHETAHVLLGREHIDRPDHGVRFQGVYERLRRRYGSSVGRALPLARG